MRVLLYHLVFFVGVAFGSKVDHDHNAGSSQSKLRGAFDDESMEEEIEFWVRLAQSNGGSVETGPTVAPSPFPTRSLVAQDELVTCISVIDENDSKNVEPEWTALREEFPDRPFCLLRPIPPGAGGGLSFPSTFFTEDIENIFSNVTRGQQDQSNPSDWYDICNLDAGKPQGLTNVVLFIDNSGSMTTGDVINSFNLFEERIAENGFKIVEAVENSSEDYIDPCLLTRLVTPSPTPSP